MIRIRLKTVAPPRGTMARRIISSSVFPRRTRVVNIFLPHSNASNERRMISMSCRLLRWYFCICVVSNSCFSCCFSFDIHLFIEHQIRMIDWNFFQDTPLDQILLVVSLYFPVSVFVLVVCDNKYILLFFFVSDPSHPSSVNVEFRKHDRCKNSDFLSSINQNTWESANAPFAVTMITQPSRYPLEWAIRICLNTRRRPRSSTRNVDRSIRWQCIHTHSIDIHDDRFR